MFLFLQARPTPLSFPGWPMRPMPLLSLSLSPTTGRGPHVRDPGVSPVRTMPRRAARTVPHRSGSGPPFPPSMHHAAPWSPLSPPLPLLPAVLFKRGATQSRRTRFFSLLCPPVEAHHDNPPLPLGLWSTPVTVPLPPLVISRAAVAVGFPLLGALCPRTTSSSN
jgi:hypothetical protein